MQYARTEAAKHGAEAKEYIALCLGHAFYPNQDSDKQKELGTKLYWELTLLHETPMVLSLISERAGTKLTISNVQEALREFGKEEIPVDDASFLDYAQIVQNMQQAEIKEEVNVQDTVARDEYALSGNVQQGNVVPDVASMFDEYNQENS
jgi:hypothetical protein